MSAESAIPFRDPRKPPRIAIVGSAPSSCNLAPFGDPEWRVWACALANAYRRGVEAHFELHSIPLLLTEPERFAAYLEQVSTIPRVYLAELDSRIPGGVIYPRARMVERFGPYFWSSSVSWMLALAIDELAPLPGGRAEPEAQIALFGVDMTGEEEYRRQRPGCHYFVQMARNAGITVSVPLESDLLHPTAQYGYCEFDPMWRKWRTRRMELMAKQQEAVEQRLKGQHAEAMYSAALNELEYVVDTWVGRSVEKEWEGRDVAREGALHPRNSAPSTLKSGDA